MCFVIILCICTDWRYLYTRKLENREPSPCCYRIVWVHRRFSIHRILNLIIRSTVLNAQQSEMKMKNSNNNSIFIMTTLRNKKDVGTFLSSLPMRSATRDTRSNGNPIELMFFANRCEDIESLWNVVCSFVFGDFAAAYVFDSVSAIKM